MKSAHLVLGVIVAVTLILAWLFRYDIKVAGRGEGPPTAYVLDRWTGGVEIHYFNGEHLKSKPRAPSPSSP